MGDPVTEWTVVLVLSILSPLIAWAILPFLRGEGIMATKYDVFVCDAARLSGIVGKGGQDPMEDRSGAPSNNTTLMIKKTHFDN